MVRLSRLILGSVLTLATASSILAAAWTGGRASGNTGSYADVPFPQLPATVWKSYIGDNLAGKTPTNALIAGKSMIFAADTTLFAVSTETGEVRWTQTLESAPLNQILLLDNQIIVTIPSSGVCAFSPDDGKQIWKRSIFSIVVNPPLFSDDVLLFATKANMMEVVERKTGKSITSINVHANIEASPLLVGKSILVGFKRGNLVRIENGINRWSASLPADAAISYNPVTNGQITLINTTDTIYSLNMSSATAPIRWPASCPNMLPESVTLDGNRVYAATTTGKMIALDATTGKPVWGNGIDLPAPATAMPIVIGNDLLVRMKYGLLAAYSKDDGKMRWSYRIPAADKSAEFTIGTPVVDGEDCYFPASDGNVYHLAASMADYDAPTFSKVLPTMAGIDFAGSQPLQYAGAVIDDEGVGVQPESVTLKIDNVDLSSKLERNILTGYYYVKLNPAMSLTPGTHQIVMTAKDYRGNQGTLSQTFYVGNAATIERVPIVINGEYLPKRLTVRPGTILEWVNNAGGPRTVIADTNAFSSDAQYPNGIPHGANFVWVVPANAQSGMKIAYHCRLNGESGTGGAMGAGLAGMIEVVDAKRDVPGVPKYSDSALPNFPTPEFAK